MDGLISHTGTQLVTRDQLVQVVTPEPTATFKPIPHSNLVDEVHHALIRRQLNVIREEYAVTTDGMRLFGILDLTTSAADFRFSIGIRNANDRSMRFGMVAGLRCFVCDNMAFVGEFFAIQAKHSKHLIPVDAIALGVDRIQRNFTPLMEQVERFKQSQLTDAEAKVIIYDAFIGDKLDAPKHLAKVVADHYFNPKYPDFEPRNVWSISNAFTSAFKVLDPVPQFRATASLGKLIAES